MGCEGGTCSITHKPRTPVRVLRSSSYRTSKPKPVSTTKVHKHNCADCHEHKHDNPKVKSLAEKIHEKQGHKCNDHSCDIPEPHGHIHQEKKNTEKEHVHGPHCNHGHDHKEEKEHVHGPNCNHDHDHKEKKKEDTGFKPLELLINKSNFSTPVKQILLNMSFLAPALSINSLLENTKLPTVFKALTSLSGMHFLNRGTHKLSRLGLSSLVAGGASMSQNKTLARFLATTAVAVIEKFGGNGHFHNFETNSKKPIATRVYDEFITLTKNLSDSKQWKELIPGLLNVESKVQLLVPLTNKLISKFLDSMNAESNSMLKTALTTALTSLNFVAFDQLLTYIGTAMGHGSAFASMASTACGCCGSPVCTAAATDSVLQNTL